MMSHGYMPWGPDNGGGDTLRKLFMGRCSGPERPSSHKDARKWVSVPIDFGVGTRNGVRMVFLPDF